MSGKRNEAARERRRQMMRIEGDLVSLSRTELDTESSVYSHKNLTIENHFGWRVLETTQLGDGNLPYEVQNRSSEKATYALYQNKGTMTDQKTLMKSTQTKISEKSPIGTKHFKPPTSHKYPEPLKTDTSFKSTEPIKKPPEETKRRKFIHEFYPRNSSKSRFRTRTQNYVKNETDTKLVNGFQGDENPYLQSSEYSVQERSINFETPLKKVYPIEENLASSYRKLDYKPQNNPDNESEDGRGPLGNQGLRAGTEVEEPARIENERNMSKNTGRSFKVIDKLKPKPKNEYLLDTVSGVNKYLYVSRKRSKKHVLG